MPATELSTAVFERHRGRLFGLTYRMLGSRADAEDIVQETWLRWHQAREQPIENPEAWLVTAASRLAIDRLRRLRTERDACIGRTERAYHNLLHFNALAKGGHFAAWEQPQLFSEEVRTGFKSLRK